LTNKAATTNALLLVVFLLLSTACIAQPNKKDLESKKKKLQDDINYTSKLLKETKTSKNNSLKELAILNNQIGKRQNLINTLKDEVTQLDNRIEANQQSYDSLSTSLTSLKKEFARVVNFTYKYRHNTSTMAYLLAGEDFAKAYNRSKYLTLYARYRKAQARKIEIVQKQLVVVNTQIDTDLKNKVSVLGANEKEKKVLTNDKQAQEKIVKNLQKTEATLKTQLAKKKAEAAKLSSAINTIIENDIKASKVKAAKTAKAPEKKGSTTAKKVEPVKENVITLTPEAKITSTGFENNKGRLPWPVEKGFISSGFGAHPHPVLKGITTNNNGIDISTDRGATARAIFDGDVSGVVNIPGAGQAVIIRHGEYLTVYSNLGSVSVSKGSKVKAKQSIGTVGADDDGAVLHLEVWKNKTKLNPSGWLIAR
jgi:septal ring factor EnvC (AmiA/AmiB activator)